MPVYLVLEIECVPLNSVLEIECVPVNLFGACLLILRRVPLNSGSVPVNSGGVPVNSGSVPVNSGVSSRACLVILCF